MGLGARQRSNWTSLAEQDLLSASTAQGPWAESSDFGPLDLGREMPTPAAQPPCGCVGEGGMPAPT
jgi:hypothetical protein